MWLCVLCTLLYYNLMCPHMPLYLKMTHTNWVERFRPKYEEYDDREVGVNTGQSFALEQPKKYPKKGFSMNIHGTNVFARPKSFVHYNERAVACDKNELQIKILIWIFVKFKPIRIVKAKTETDALCNFVCAKFVVILCHIVSRMVWITIECEYAAK